jgi:hypothetical protein
MRLSMAIVSFLVSAALLAGCSSSSQGTSALPGSGSTQSMGNQVGAFPLMPTGKSNSLELLKLQAEGKLRGPVPTKVLQAQLKQLETHPSVHFNLRSNGGGVGIWTAMTNYDYLLGTNKSGKKVTAAIETSTNDCDSPITVKIDHTQNIWTACEKYTATGQSAAQEYSSGGTLENTYEVGCPESGSNSCEGSTNKAYGFDTAENSSYVFAALQYFDFDICDPSCNPVTGGGFEYWPAGDPTATPKLIALPYGDPVYGVYYADVDVNGNLWFNYEGCVTYCGIGIAELQNPTSPSASLVEIANPPCCSTPVAGGVYASNGGRTINVLDQGTRIITQYDLSGNKTGALGPVVVLGDPVAMGFNSTDTKIVAGDCDGWLDIGKVSTNKWRPEKPVEVSSCLEGAAYTPSDK